MPWGYGKFFQREVFTTVLLKYKIEKGGGCVQCVWAALLRIVRGEKVQRGFTWPDEGMREVLWCDGSRWVANKRGRLCTVCPVRMVRCMVCLMHTETRPSEASYSFRRNDGTRRRVGAGSDLL